jgi:glutamate racemase
VRKVVEPLVEAGADKIVLGCTHYPFLRSVIERVAGEGVEIIDSAAAIARRVASLLDERGLRAEEDVEQSCRYISFAGEEYVEKLKKKDR